MEKLAQLLNEHKDKLWDWEYFRIEIYKDPIGGDMIIEAESQISAFVNRKKLYSLSDLLFNTPFLSWLEWNGRRWWTNWIHNYAYEEYDTVTEDDSDYHKVNLVLLSTDSERIAYLESHTL